MESVFYNLGNIVAEKGKGLRGEGRISPSPRTPTPILAGFLISRKCLRHFLHCMAFMQKTSFIFGGIFPHTPCGRAGHAPTLGFTRII